MVPLELSKRHRQLQYPFIVQIRPVFPLLQKNFAGYPLLCLRLTVTVTRLDQPHQLEHSHFLHFYLILLSRPITTRYTVGYIFGAAEHSFLLLQKDIQAPLNIVDSEAATIASLASSPLSWRQWFSTCFRLGVRLDFGNFNRFLGFFASSRNDFNFVCRLLIRRVDN